MTDYYNIWTNGGRVWGIWDNGDGEQIRQFFSCAAIEDFRYTSNPMTCVYCGHLVDGRAVLSGCPGCGARLARRGSDTVIGKANITLCERMPSGIWLMNPPPTIEIHFGNCGNPSIYNRYDGRIVMNDIKVKDCLFTGFNAKFGEREAVAIHLIFECNVIIETDAGD